MQVIKKDKIAKMLSIDDIFIVKSEDEYTYTLQNENEFFVSMNKEDYISVKNPSLLWYFEYEIEGKWTPCQERMTFDEVIHFVGNKPINFFFAFGCIQKD